jgi:hypothetical protein
MKEYKSKEPNTDEVKSGREREKKLKRPKSKWYLRFIVHRGSKQMLT